MPLKVYKGGEPTEPHEGSHVDRLYHALKQNFDNVAGSALLLVPPIPDGIGGVLRPDAILWVHNKFFILELKDISCERVVPDCRSQDSVWQKDDGHGLVPLDFPHRKNPFFQVKGYYRVLEDWLYSTARNIYDLKKYADDQDRIIHLIRDIRRGLAAWIVLNDVKKIDEPIGLQGPERNWFRVLSLVEVPRAVMQQKSGSSIFGQEHFAMLLKEAKVKGPFEDWLTEDKRSSYPEVPNQEIDLLLSSKEPNKVIQALKYIADLNLKYYENQISEYWKSDSSDLRMAALDIAIKWKIGKLGEILRQGLSDDNGNVRSISWHYIKSRDVPEVFDTLVSILSSNQLELFPHALEAILRSSNPKMIDVVLGLSRRMFGNKAFLKFLPILELHEEMSKSSRNYEEFHDRIKRFAEMEREYSMLKQLLVQVIDAFGNLRIEQAASWLMDIVSSPSALGIDSEKLQVFQKLDYPSIEESAIVALGKIGSKLAVQLFTEKLKTVPDLDESIITALGRIGDPSTSELILPYLSSEHNSLRIKAIISLGQLKSKMAFEPISKIFFSKQIRKIYYSPQHVADALHSIDAARFEELLMQKISDRNLKPDVRDFYLMFLGPIATGKSIPLLHQLSMEPQFNDYASYILQKLEATE